jgi:glycosyltransferase involved in cell wall biosynthesis
MNACFVIPIYEHGDTIRDVVESIAEYRRSCIVADDGSDAATRHVLDQIENDFPWVEVLHSPANQGKGAAVERAMRRAATRGFTHAVTLDADGQHHAPDAAKLLEASRTHPDSMVLAVPLFDEAAPRSRRFGRLISTSWVWIETLSFAIRDPLCGFRCLPIRPALAVMDRVRMGRRMDFDPELVVRMAWAGVPVVSVPSPVHYFPGGLSHFDMLRDNVRISWLHTRLFIGMLVRLPVLVARRVSAWA